MVIEFNAIIEDDSEIYEKQQNVDLKGQSSVSFFNERDKVVKYAVDMNTISGYLEETVYFNSEEKICTYGIRKDGKMTHPLLITVVDFKELFELAKSQKVFTANELLN